MARLLAVFGTETGGVKWTSLCCRDARLLFVAYEVVAVHRQFQYISWEQFNSFGATSWFSNFTTRIVTLSSIKPTSTQGQSMDINVWDSGRRYGDGICVA